MLQNQYFRTTMLTSVLKFAALCFASFSITMQVYAAEVYRWVDENGVVTYSQQKPKHTDSHTLSTIAAPPSAKQAQLRAKSAQPPPPKAELSAEQQQKLVDLELEETTRVKEETARRASNCALSTKLLTQLTTKERVRVRAPDGTHRIVPEEERQESITAARQGIEKNCS